MAHNHQHKQIPSPFKTVNQYEKEFVEVFNKNLAATVTDVLKYIASATTANINNLNQEDNVKN